MLECAPLEPRPSAMREGREAESGAMPWCTEGRERDANDHVHDGDWPRGGD
jgi:hypothetical protein